MRTFVFFLFVIVGLPVFAKVEFGTPFADGAVLQRDRALPVWGRADPGEEVAVSFGGSRAVTRADSEGRWRVTLPPMTASKEGRALTANDAVARDVLVGEVWFAAGQSNMDCPIWAGGYTRYRDGKGAMMSAMANQPYVRYFQCPFAWSTSTVPIQVKWKKLVSANISRDSFSAVAFYFARELYLALDVPVGIVDASWGGTNIDAWTPRCGYDDCDPSIRAVADYPVRDKTTWKKKDKPKPDDPEAVITIAHQQPTVLFNGMVASWAPMSMRGFIWYQGCHNAWQAATYCAKMHALYNGWARAFENPELKLYFAELAPHGTSWNKIVAQQMKFASEEKNSAIAVLSDIGNFDDIHPNDKETVAQRLVIHALRRDYGLPIAEDDSPVCSSVEPQTNGTLKVTFAHARKLYVYRPDGRREAPFEVAETNGAWQAAEIVNYRQAPKGGWVDKYMIDAPYVLLKSEKVGAPVRVRYMGQCHTSGSLYSEMSLPLGPFEAGAR